MKTKAYWRRQTGGRCLGIFLLAMALCALLPGRAHASCKLSPHTGQGTLVFDPPARINVPFDAPIGTILWASPMETPTPVPDLLCDNSSPNQTGINGSAQSVGGIPTFPTTNPAIGYQIANNSMTTWMQAYPDGPELPAQRTLVNGQALLRLVKLAPISNGSALGGSTLGYWDVRGIGHVVTLRLSHRVTFLAPACTVTTDPTHVTLPVVPAGAFQGKGSTAGETAFAIQLRCSAGLALSVTLDTNRPAAGTTGVIAAQRGTGYAQGIGIQVLDQNGQPVTFKHPIQVGPTPGGALAVRYIARYYQTGKISPGQVSATATFTLSYP